VRQRQGRAGQALDTQRLQTRAGAYDINQSVQPSEFVEVDFLDGYAMYGGFSLRKRQEHALRLLAHARREGQAGEDLGQFAVGAVGMVVATVCLLTGGYGDLRSSQPTAPDLRSFETDLTWKALERSGERL
jgi:hypothetical protein